VKDHPCHRAPDVPVGNTPTLSATALATLCLDVNRRRQPRSALSLAAG
jgi:hypothetical protein